MFNFNPSEPKALKKFWTREIRRILLLDVWCFVLFFTVLVTFYPIEVFFGYGESVTIIEEANDLFMKKDITPDPIETKSINMHIYPLYPFFLKICTFICFGSKWISLPLSSLILTFFATLSFYYFLYSYKKIEHIIDSILLSLIFPFVFQLQRYTLSEETLFFIEICLFFAFIYKKQFAKSLIICSLSVFTVSDGILLSLVFIIIMLKNIKFKNIIYMFLALSNLFALSYYHYIKYNDAFLILKYMKQYYTYLPFVSILNFMQESTVYFFSVFILAFLIPLFTSVHILSKESFPLFIMGLLTIIELIFVNDHNYEYRMSAIVTFFNSVSFIQGFEQNKYAKFSVEAVIIIKIIFACILPIFINHYFVGFEELKDLMI